MLVRQNFLEDDVGDTKVDALARRLTAISDTVEIIACDASTPSAADLVDTDLIADATVNIAISRLLDGVAGWYDRPVLAQVATDARTGTLGMLTVSMPALNVGPLSIDRQAGQRVCQDGALEAFHGLWDSSALEDQIIPTRGCSTPTFHGSAADLAGVAASLTSILGITSPMGTHCLARTSSPCPTERLDPFAPSCRHPPQMTSTSVPWP